MPHRGVVDVPAGLEPELVVDRAGNRIESRFLRLLEFAKTPRCLLPFHRTSLARSDRADRIDARREC